MITIERELIRNSQSKHQLASLLKKSRVIALSSTEHVNPDFLTNKRLKSRICFQKYIQPCLLITFLVTFFLFFGVLCALLVADLFNLNWTFLQTFWASLSPPTFLLLCFLFMTSFFGLLLIGLLQTKLGYFTQLVPDHQTDTASLNYLAVNINRIMAPFCLYVLRMFNVPEPEFNKIMIQQNVLSIIIEYFNRYLSVLLVLFILLKLGNCYKRIRRCFGFQRFKIGDNKTRREHVAEGNRFVVVELRKFSENV